MKNIRWYELDEIMSKNDISVSFRSLEFWHLAHTLKYKETDTHVIVHAIGDLFETKKKYIKRSA